MDCPKRESITQILKTGIDAILIADMSSQGHLFTPSLILENIRLAESFTDDGNTQWGRMVGIVTQQNIETSLVKIVPGIQLDKSLLQIRKDNPIEP